MSVIDFTEQQIKTFVESKRPIEEIRDQLDIGYSYDGRSAEILEIRPQWDDPSIIHKYPIAKATYTKSQKIWKIYWKRASGKWQSYEPQSEVTTIQDFLSIIEEDTHGCFWG
ncbi:DUF3024 domain-containing protein [Aquimarina sp. M1]